MEIRRKCQCLRVGNIVSLYLIVVALATSVTHCDARRPSSSRRLLDDPPSPHKSSLFLLTAAKLNLVNYLNYDSSNSGSYGVSSPFTLPPYDSLAPISLPQNSPPYCIYPPQTPSTTPPSPTGFTPTTPLQPPIHILPPILPIQNPPPSPPDFTPNPNPYPPGTIFPSPPNFTPNPDPNPPGTILPSPPEYISTPTNPSPPEYIPTPTNPSPPEYIPTPTNPSPSGPVLSPPIYEPGPPGLVPTPYPPPYSFSSPPFGFIPRPPMFLPPIVYPPPRGPPPRSTAPIMALWCVAKPTVPDPIIQEAMNYACGSGADCDSIQTNGSCFEPNTLFAHASFAFNSYWQRTKVAGGTCEFGGTAMLVTVDPSYDGCHFVYI